MIKTILDNSKIINEDIYDSVSGFHDSMSRIEKDGKYGFINKNGNEVIKPIYLSATSFNDGVSIISINKNGKILYGLIDKKGCYVLEPKYDKITGFKNGYSWFYLDDKCGVIDNHGKIVIEPKYEPSYYIYPTYDSIITLRKGNKNMALNINGKKLFEFDNYDVSPFNNNNFTTIRPSNYIADEFTYGLMDYKGKIILDIQDEYFKESKIKYNMLILGKKNKHYIIDETGFKHKFPNYDYIDILYYNTLVVAKDKKYFLVDTYGKPKNNIMYDYIGKLRNDRAIIKKNGKYGFIDKTLNEVVGPKYDSVSEFNDKLAVVNMNGKEGIIDIDGNVVADTVYDYIGGYHSGYFKIIKDKKYGYLSKNGSEVILKKQVSTFFKLECYGKISDKYIVLFDCDNNEYTFLDTNDGEIFKVSFNDIRINDGMIVIDNKYILKENEFKLVHNLKLGNLIDKNFDSIKECTIYSNLFKEEVKERFNNILYKDIESSIDEKISYKKRK